jgi:hypothetical protein
MIGAKVITPPLLLVLPLQKLREIVIFFCVRFPEGKRSVCDSQ